MTGKTVTVEQYHLGHGTYEVGAWIARSTDTTGPEYRQIAKVIGKQPLKARYSRTVANMYPNATIKFSDKVGR